GDSWRREGRERAGRRSARRRDLRHRVLLPGRAARSGAHPCPALGRAHVRARRSRRGGVREGRSRSRSHLVRARVKSRAEPGIWLEDVPKPSIGPNDLLVRVHYTSICGTDLHIFNWDPWAQKTIKVPLVIGHEFEGSVAEIGSEVTGFEAGQRVAVEGHVTCGHCRNCRAGRRHLCRNAVGIGVQRPGAFAEFIAVPAANAYVLPPGMPDEIGSCLDPLGNAVHSALSFELAGEDVLITGAGPIGVMAAAVAKMVGARYIVVTDSNAYRLDLARRMGATLAVDYRTTTLDQVMAALGMLEGFDIGLEMSGAPQALRGMLQFMNNGGRVALLGIPSE